MLVKNKAQTIISPIQTMVDQFIDYCDHSRGMSMSTIRTRKTHLSQFSRYCFEQGVFSVSNLSPAFVDDYFSFYQQTHTKNTTNTGRRIMKSFLKWLLGYKELSLNIKPETIQLVRTPRALPKAIDVNIINSAIKASQEAQDGLIIQFLTQSGVRISELVNIRVEDISGDSITINGKGLVQRVVYISEELALSLRNHVLSSELEPFDYLFSNTFWGGGKLTTGTARLRVQKCFEKVGVEMHPHQLRHSFAISLLENGCDIVTIQRLLGHADIQTTMVYLRVTDTFLKNAYKKYTNFA